MWYVNPEYVGTGLIPAPVEFLEARRLAGDKKFFVVLVDGVAHMCGMRDPQAVYGVTMMLLGEGIEAICDFVYKKIKDGPEDQVLAFLQKAEMLTATLPIEMSRYE